VAHKVRQAHKAHKAYKVTGVHKDCLEQPDLRDRQARKGRTAQPDLRDHGASRASKGKRAPKGLRGQRGRWEPKGRKVNEVRKVSQDNAERRELQGRQVLMVLRENRATPEYPTFESRDRKVHRTAMPIRLKPCFARQLAQASLRSPVARW
jgi:hypothetical protein